MRANFRCQVIFGIKWYTCIDMRFMIEDTASLWLESAASRRGPTSGRAAGGLKWSPAACSGDTGPHVTYKQNNASISEVDSKMNVGIPNAVFVCEILLMFRVGLWLVPPEAGQALAGDFKI